MYYNYRVKTIIFITFIQLISFIYFPLEKNDSEKIQYKQDELAIVSAYYKIKSKHKPRTYLDWISNFVLLNKSIVLFSSKKFIRRLKSLRPKELFNKTVFISVEINEFYSYKNFYSEFEKSFAIDFERRHHSIPLYLIWAEKCNFMKKVIINNYFNSTCFYWIDMGYFREKKNFDKYLNNWPSTKKCYEDPKLLMGQVKNFSNSEKERILNFNIEEHIKLRKNINVIGGIFGGQSKNILKFIDLYYYTVRLFIKKGIFIGKDQNIFTYMAFSHPEVIKLIFCRKYTEYREHIS